MSVFKAVPPTPIPFKTTDGTCKFCLYSNGAHPWWDDVTPCPGGEIERLQTENASLRTMLTITTETPAEIVQLRGERDRAVEALETMQIDHAQAQQAIGMARLYLDRFSKRPNRISEQLAALSSPVQP